MVRLSLLSALVACACGCLREPVFTHRDGGAGDGNRGDGGTSSEDVTAVESGGIRVVGPHFAMRFAPDNFELPVESQIDGVDLIGEGQRCNDEKGLGIGLFPPLGINGFENFGRTAASSRIVLAGPAIAQVEVTTNATYTCTDGETLDTRSLFTFYADGRISRYDSLTASAATANACTTCAGPVGNGSFFQTSYTTLLADGATLDTDFGQPGLSYGASASSGASACLDNAGRQVAVTWLGNRARRIRVVDDQPRTLAFVEDIATGPSIGGLADASTTLLLRRGDSCASMRDAVERFRGSRNITITTSTGPTPIGPSPDGIYGSPPFQFDPPVGAFTLEPVGASIPGAWALWAEFGAQPTSNVSVVHSNAAKQGGIRMQRVDGENQIIFVVRDALDAGETITITPG